MFGGEGAGFGEGAALQLFGEERSAGDGGGAAAAEKANFEDAGMFEAGGEAEDVAADWIGNFDDDGGAGKFTGIAGITEVVEDGCVEHW